MRGALRRTPTALAPLLATAALAGCAHLPWSADGEHCPVSLVSPEALPALRIHQRLRFADPDGPGGAAAEHEAPPAGAPTPDASVRVDAVAQVGAGEITVVGLTPAGTRAFSVQQVGDAVHVERGVARWLGVHPVWVVDALHRARLIGLGEAPAADGEHVAAHDGEERVDVWRGGLRVARRFSRPGEPSAVRIEYRFDDDAVDDVPRVIAIENDWCGYRARITTFSEERLP